MIVPIATLLPNIKMDFKRIELLRRAAVDKSIKITPDLLAKLNEVETVDDLISKPSTSNIVAVEVAAPRRGAKRKVEEMLKAAPKEEDKCAKCGCRMLRSVDPKRPDKKRVLECMRSNCLASLKFTDLPAGTVVGKEVSTNKSFYNSLARYYPKSRYTPTPPSDDEDAEPRVSSRKPKNRSEIFERTNRGIFLHVPGQETLAALQ